MQSFHVMLCMQRSRELHITYFSVLVNNPMDNKVQSEIQVIVYNNNNIF